MSFRCWIVEWRYRYKRDKSGQPVACVLPKKPSIRRLPDDFQTQSGVKAFAELVIKIPHPQGIPTKPRMVRFVDLSGKEIEP